MGWPALMEVSLMWCLVKVALEGCKERLVMGAL